MLILKGNWLRNTKFKELKKWYATPQFSTAEGTIRLVTFKFVHILFVQPETFTKVTPPSKKKKKKDLFFLHSETSIKDIVSI